MSRIPNHNIDELEKRIGYKFKNPELLLNALTHSSYANENRGRISDNERLEFLGDAVLGLVIADYLYRLFEEHKEGDLTKIRASIVSEEPLSLIARDIGLGQFLLLGKGEANTGGRDRDSVLADAVEAVIGAVYLEAGINQAKELIIGLFSSLMEKSFQGKGFQDYKTNLQEMLQAKGEEEIVYRVIKESGPDHNKEFVVEVLCGRRVIGRGKGKSKKEAEQRAAKEALEKIHG
ncbi:MAG: ribonuclease III [Caldicoprobacterales bacterium]|jgi:ribonuclease-3|nr:ribonuclease III [Clostridiales bacterium]